jgi:hypothetical protein
MERVISINNVDYSFSGSINYCSTFQATSDHKGVSQCHKLLDRIKSSDLLNIGKTYTNGKKTLRKRELLLLMH